MERKLVSYIYSYIYYFWCSSFFPKIQISTWYHFLLLWKKLPLAFLNSVDPLSMNSLRSFLSINVFTFQWFPVQDYAVVPFSVSHKTSRKVCFTKSLVTGALGNMGRKASVGGKSFAQRRPQLGGKRSSRDQDSQQQKLRTEMMQTVLLLTWEQPKVSAMMHTPPSLSLGC